MGKTKYSVGFDLGGTKLASALVDAEGTLLDYHKVKLFPEGDLSTPLAQQKTVISAMVECALHFRASHPQCFKAQVFHGFGLASAGPLNVATGELLNPHNFKGWKKVPIQRRLAEALGLAGFKGPVFFQNDAMAASLGEGWVGAARGDLSYVVITVGTGVGSGLILNGRPVQTRGMGSEWGHTLIDFSLTKKTEGLHHHTVEGMASGTGLLRRAKELGFTGVSTEELVLALRAGETKWQTLFDDAGRALATLCYILSVGCHLDRILISGGLIHVKDLFMPELKSYYKGLITQMNVAFGAPIQIARLKDRAGVLGAARLPFL